MSRPDRFRLFSTTPFGGIKFQWLIDEYQSKWVRDGAVEVVKALVGWYDSERFEQEAMGFTIWNGDTPTLLRTLPFECPTRSGLFVEEIDLVSTGAYNERTDFGNPIEVPPPFQNFPAQDWCIYRLTFRRGRFKRLTNDQLKANPYLNREQMRYTTMSLLPRPAIRTISGYGFIYDTSAAGLGADAGAWALVPDERAFVPDHKTDLHVTVHDWPLGAVPFAAIEAQCNTVNSQPIQLVPGGRIWQQGELIFKGMANPIEMFQDGNLRDMFDLSYLFTAQRGGWNNYPSRNLDTGAIQYKPMAVRRNPDVPANRPPNKPLIPPFPSTDFQNLFIPSADL